jgi:hypothetical protein
MKNTIISLCFLFSISLHAQNIGFYENFEDGELLQNPTWSGGMLDSFKINANKEMQLQAKRGGMVRIETAYNTQDALVWDMFVRMEFSPSATNALWVVLESDASPTSGSVSSGYGLLIGEDGSDDKVKLVKWEKGDISDKATVLATANNTMIRNSQVKMRLRIKRDAARLWTLEADYDGAYNFKNEFLFQEKTPFLAVPNKAHFSLKLIFTESRKDKFFFDDLKGYKNEADLIPPKAIGAKALSANELEIEFDEVVDSVSAVNLAHYNIDKNIGNPKKVNYNFTKVGLLLNNNLQAGEVYKIQINNVKDIAQNNITPQELSVTAPAFPQAASRFDVIFNEVFPDPTPQIALPKAEFIELYNRSNRSIDLSNWTLRDASNAAFKFPKYVLAPQKYLIVYKRDAKIDYGKYGDTLAISNFVSLNTEDEELTLSDDKGNVIDFFSYNLDTYKDEKRAGGGYTLERINPNTPCLGAENWRVSSSDNGGTPGKINANYSIENNDEALSLNSVFPLDASTLLLYFNRSLDNSTLSTISVSNELKIKSLATTTALDRAVLQLENAMQKGKIYELKIPNSLKDCIGNKAISETFLFALPELAEANDIVINEILFNPKTGGTDFVELYNRSKKAFNLAGLYLNNKESTSTPKVIEKNYLLLPDSYVVFSDNPENIAANFDVKNPKALIKNKLPTFSDESGNVTLYRADAPNKLVIDALDYEEDWHYPLLKDKAGVSLERISSERPTQSQDNWHSAASVVGFATPTTKNSQNTIPIKEPNTQLFSVSQERISPDNDGFEDYCDINYQTQQELNATVTIYDANGRIVKNLLNNETLGSEGSLQWNGTNNDGTIVQMGFYVLWIEYFTTDGKVGNEKKTITVVFK